METKDFDLYMTDIDYVKAEDKPIVRIFGRTSEGVPILLQIDDFLPYIFIPLEKKKQFDKCVQENQLLKEWLISTEKLTKIKYDGGEAVELQKLVGKRPWEVPKIRELLEKNNIEHFESDIPFVKRFLIDTSLRGLNVIHIDSAIKDQEQAGGYILRSQTKHIHPSDTDLLRFRKLTYLALDIEVDDRNIVEIDELKEKNRRIIAISICWGTNQDNYKTHVFYLKEDSDKAEKKLLNEFFTLFREIQPDMVIGYNVDAFDFPYIIDRAGKLKLSTKALSLLDNDTLRYSGRLRAHRMKGRVVCDIIKKIGKITTESGHRGLGDVAQKLLGTKKIEIKESVGKLWAKGVLEDDKKRLKSFIKYSEMDAILSYQLWWELELENILELTRIVGFPPAEGMYATERNQGELELMRKCVQRNVLIPNSSVPDETRQRQKMKETGDGLKGGMVIEPKGTFFKDVVILDFRSLYPSIIISYNVGGETFRSKSDGSFEFLKKPRSVLAEMEEYILSYRYQLKQQKQKLEKTLIEMKIEQKEKTDEYLDLQEELKNVDRRQNMLKLVANALWGTVGSIFGRFYLLSLANAITALGRQHLTNLVDLIEEYNTINTKHFKVVYGDTDSIFVSFAEDRSFEQLYNLTMRSKKEKISHKELKSVEKDTYTSIDHLLDFLGSKLPEGMQLELDDIAFRIAFQAERKKAYGYVSALSGELKVKGFEAIRGDWTEFAKRVQLNVIDILLRSGETEALDKAKQFVLKECRTLLESPIEVIKNDLIQYAPISKAPKKYKSITPAVGAFLHYCDTYGLDPEKEWRKISKFPYIVLKGEGPQYKRARHPTLIDGAEIDREQYVTEVLGAAAKFGVKVSLDEIRGKGKETTLFDFV
ncbi:MAG: DNA polymerase domain-containing protein [Promethearchaeota archaeon]